MSMLSVTSLYMRWAIMAIKGKEKKEKKKCLLEIERKMSFDIGSNRATRITSEDTMRKEMERNFHEKMFIVVGC
jgi:hypothetical protein